MKSELRSNNIREVSNKSFNIKEVSEKNDFNKFSLNDGKLNDLEKKLENKILAKELSNYSEDLTKFLRNPDEIKVYENSNLIESKVNDRIVLKSNEIDPNIKDAMGRTNIERMEKGKPAIDENGESYNLHHIGQKANSPLAELKASEHQSNYKVLHDSSIKTEIHGENCEVNWSKEKSEHWKERAKEVKELNNV